MTVDLILLGFLQSQKDSSPDFQQAVECLAQSIEKDGYLEADGGPPMKCISSQVGESAEHVVPDGGPHPNLDEELCRRIGAQLAELGDRFEREGVIKQEVVESLVHDVLSDTLSEERFSKAVKSLLSNVPAGIEQETASLVVAMTLTSKVGKMVPNLLANCCSTTSRFIERNYSYYIDRLTGQR
ncbi:BH3-interacting domain death agonist-like [Hyperolius riggenbachi]|uniref:BH3-interacting domain death agonist-like n=1 Tax=Hyperolius riggenbachi TaxID=752182 RepID=UPI0035A26AC8